MAGAPAPLDALQFVIEVRDRLALPADRLPIYLDEITSTLHGSAYKHGRAAPNAAELALADYQTIETSMIEATPASSPTTAAWASTPRTTTPTPRGRRADPRDVAGGAQGQRALRLPVRHGL